MCLAIPGKVIEIEKDRFIVDYGAERREAIATVVEVRKGDYVIVSNKVIVEKVKKDDAEKFLELLDES